MRLLVWNIQNGGGARLPHIVEEIAAYDPDVVAVTEYRAGPGVALCAALKERGLPYCETTNPSFTERRRTLSWCRRGRFEAEPGSTKPLLTSSLDDVKACNNRAVRTVAARLGVSAPFQPGPSRATTILRAEAPRGTSGAEPEPDVVAMPAGRSSRSASGCGRAGPCVPGPGRTRETDWRLCGPRRLTRGTRWAAWRAGPNA